MNLTFYPENFNFQDAIVFFKNNQTLYTYSLVFYLPMCQVLQSFHNPKHKTMYKNIGFGWNVFLSMFSFMGVFMTIPPLVKCLQLYGLSGSILQTETICNFLDNNKTSFWGTIFTLSKIPEFMDTFLYVLKNGKQHIFLHWYHHLFTAFYSYWMTIKPDGPSKLGHWMVSLNFFVHAFMYAYFAVMEITERESKIRKIVMHYASFITTIQTVQMFIMIYIFFYDKVLLGNNFDHFGFGMYLVYAILFSKLFFEKYFTKVKVK
jgi:elongation of very long chain fatty acids protein 6